MPFFALTHSGFAILSLCIQHLSVRKIVQVQFFPCIFSTNDCDSMMPKLFDFYQFSKTPLFPARFSRELHI